MNIELLERIEQTSGKLAKEELLKEADGELRLFLEQCLDPDITYGITSPGEAESSFCASTENKNDRPFWKVLQRFLDQTARRLLTGNVAQAMMRSVLASAPTRIHFKWACRFIDKNLRAGFDIQTYNRVFGEGTVQKFSVQLADTYEADELRGLWFVQPKLDGNRVVLIDGRAMSRNGKEYPNCEHVIAEVERKHPDFFKSWVLDGEMMGDLGFDKSSGALRRINEKNQEKATFTYWAFDVVRRHEWERRKTKDLSSRDGDLRSLFTDIRMETLRLVPTYRVKDPSHKQVMEFCDEFVENGFEGAMFKDASSPYVFKRGKNLLKVKKFFDGDFGVVDLYEGKGKHRGRLGGIIVEGEHNRIHIRSRVGSGFDDEMRERIWKDQDGWRSAVVQVQFQEATKDGSLRFPVFITRRKDKE